MVTMSSISRLMAGFFVRISSHGTYPLVVAAYSAVLGLFVPSSGGSEVGDRGSVAVLQAAKDLHVHLGWVVQIYNAAEALPNLINPFWMLPLLGLMKMRARDLVGFGLLQLVCNTALVFFVMWLLAKTFVYVPPMIP